jgi:hypothetical protein
VRVLVAKNSEEGVYSCSLVASWRIVSGLIGTSQTVSEWEYSELRSDVLGSSA